MKKLKIIQFLMAHFNGRSNDYQETIKLLEVGTDKVSIQTEFTINMDITDELEAFMMNGPGDMPRNLIKEKLNENYFIDDIGFNYVTGFYLEWIEGLSIDHFLDNCKYTFKCNRYLKIQFNMGYKLESAQIEEMMIGYKNCA